MMEHEHQDVVEVRKPQKRKTRWQVPVEVERLHRCIFDTLPSDALAGIRRHVSEIHRVEQGLGHGPDTLEEVWSDCPERTAQHVVPTDYLSESIGQCLLTQNPSDADLITEVVRRLVGDELIEEPQPLLAK